MKTIKSVRVLLLSILIIGMIIEGNAYAGEVKVKMWLPSWPPETIAVYEKFAKEYSNVKPQVEIVVEVYAWPAYDEELLPTAIAGGVGPEIFLTFPLDIRKWVNAGVTYVLDDYFSEEFKEDLVPAALDGVTVGGHFHAFPFQMDPVALFYDKELFKKTGQRPPETWSEVITTAEKLSTPERWGVDIPTGTGEFLHWMWTPFLWQTGADYVDKDWSRCLLDHPGTVKALNFFGTLVKNKLAPSDSTAIPYAVPNRKAAMSFDGIWALLIAEQQFPEFEYGVAHLPIPEKGGKQVTICGGNLWAVNSKSKHPKEAAEYLVWLLAGDPGRIIELNTRGLLSISPRRSVMQASKEFWDKYPKSIFRDEILPTARPEPQLAPEIRRIVTEMLEGVMFREVDAEKAIMIATKEINNYLAKR